MRQWWTSPGFGRLEAEVMEIIWRQTEAPGTGVSVNDVAVCLKRPLAYTTVMTTLDRLFKKGVLQRRKSDRAYRYSARISRRQFEQKRTGDFVAEFLDGSQTSCRSLVSCLVEAVGERDRALLDELERSIRQKRRELERHAKP